MANSFIKKFYVSITFLILNSYVIIAQNIPIQNIKSLNLGQMLVSGVPTSFSKQAITNAVTIDRFDNFYTTSRFSGQFSTNIQGTITSYTNTGIHDSYVLKHDLAGNITWAQQLTSNSTTSSVSTFDISADYNGDIYVCGSFIDGFSVSQEIGGNMIITGSLPNKVFGFLLKLNGLTGKAVWVKVFDTSTSNAHHIAHTVASNKKTNTGKIFVSGHYDGSLNIPDVTSPINFISGNNWDIFIVCYDYDGVYQSHTTGNGGGADIPLNSTVDNVGNFILAGEFLDNISFGAISLNNSSPTFYDAYLAKFDENLNPIWAFGVGSTTKTDRFIDVDTDSDDNIIVVGSMSRGVNINPLGTSTIINPKIISSSSPSLSSFLGKYTPDGIYSDGFILSTTANTNQQHNFTGVGVTSDNSIIVSGFAKGVIDYNPYGIPILNNPPINVSDNSFIASYYLNGSSSILNYNYSFFGGKGGRQFRALDLEVSSCSGFIALSGAYSIETEMEPNVPSLITKKLFDVNPSLILTDNFVAFYRPYCIPLASNNSIYNKKEQTTDLKNILLSEDDIKVYPNPGDGIFSIVSALESLLYDLRIFDLSGKIVFENRYYTNNPKVDISHLKNGTYLVQVSVGDEIKGKVYIKQ